MRKNISKLIACILAGCLFLTGCSNEYFGIPGIFMEVVETLGDPDFYEGVEEYDPDIWTWPDTEEEEISETFDWDEFDHDEEIDSDPGTVTILVYMNGSTLETEAGFASKDIQEMLDAGYSENVNIVIQTMGTKYWSSRHGIASNRSSEKTVWSLCVMTSDSLTAPSQIPFMNSFSGVPEHTLQRGTFSSSGITAADPLTVSDGTNSRMIMTI